MTLVKSLVKSTVGKLTGKKLYDEVLGMKLTKSTAIQIIAIFNALKYDNTSTDSIVKQSKEYLLKRCSGNEHTDSATGLTVVLSENGSTKITSAKIEKLQEQIKAEKAKILKAETEINGGKKTTAAMAAKLAKKIAGAKITRTKYTNFKLKK